MCYDQSVSIKGGYECCKRVSWTAYLRCSEVDRCSHLEVHALLALQDANELTRDDTALVDELVEGVLPIGTGLSKVHLARLKGQPGAINGHPFPVALHGHLFWDSNTE